MKPLYIIHGWTYTITPWQTTIDLLRKAGIPVKILKVPGLTEPSKKVFTIDDYVKWANANIPDGSIALGHSNGGRILLNLCAAKPDKLQHLILLDSAGVYEESQKTKIVKKLAKFGAPLKKIPLLRKVFHKAVGASDYDHAPVNMKQTLANMLASDKSLDLAKVATPTSILWGRADTVTPPHQAEILHQQLPDSTLEFYDKWTHAPYISHPAGLAAAIKKAYAAALKSTTKTVANSNTTAPSTRSK